MKIRYITFFSILCLTACAPKIKDFGNYQKQFLPKTSFMPTKENLQGKNVKIVVFALDHDENEVAIQANLGDSIARNVENIISNNHLGEIVDRKAAKKLQKEIILSELNGTRSYKGPVVADYAISGAISNAGFTSKYSAGFFYPDPKNGHIVTVPPRYTYSSDVSGNLKIYELPSLQVIESIEFSDKKSRKENVKQDGGLDWGGLQIGGKKDQGKQRDDNLVRQTGKSAVKDIEVEIKNFFAKKGYILEKRIYGKKSIFKISLGSLDGIKQGDKFEVIGKFESKNEITQEIDIERRILARGVVSDKINPTTAWVIIKDPKKVDYIRLGDALKIKYKRSGLAKAAKLTKNLLGN